VRTGFCVFFSTITLAVAAALPLTVKEISLMLRSGYNAAAVERELTTRHFVDNLDEMKRQQLIHAGVTPQLLQDIETGKFAVPKEEVENSRRKLEQESQQRAHAAEQSKKLNTLYQAQQAKERAFAAAQPQSDIIARVVKGNLVRSQNGNLVSFYDEELNRKKIYGLYFSAHWCAPCRKFTPELIAYYNRVAREHPEFEIIFLSMDKTADAMAAYMRETGMPWPAVDFAKRPTVNPLFKYAGSAIPDLVIVDGTGKVLADSYVNGNYIGPAKVLENLDAIFKGSPQVAASR
jgi:nucleoredoxin